MDLTQPREEATTEDLQAGVIRAIFRSRSRRKPVKDGVEPEAAVQAMERKQPTKRTDLAIAEQRHKG